MRQCVLTQLARELVAGGGSSIGGGSIESPQQGSSKLESGQVADDGDLGELLVWAQQLAATAWHRRSCRLSEQAPRRQQGPKQHGQGGNGRHDNSSGKNGQRAQEGRNGGGAAAAAPRARGTATMVALAAES